MSLGIQKAPTSVSALFVSPIFLMFIFLLNLSSKVIASKNINPSQL